MKNVIVLFGGTSTEHSISLKTGHFIYRTLDRNKFNCKPVFLCRSGKWLISNNFNIELPEIKTDPNYSTTFEADFRSQVSHVELDIPKDKMGADIVCLGLHGGNGENGTMQAFLELLGLRYTGSRVLASALAMNKEKSNRLFQQAGFPMANFSVFTRGYGLQSIELPEKIQFPVFVKPNEGGSSVGTGIANNLSELHNRLREVFAIEETAIVQNLVKGIEVSCGVIEYLVDGKFIPKALFPTEIVPSSEFFDFSSKYTTGKSQEITPARLLPEVTERVRKLALQAHLVLGCRGYSRTDFIIKENIPYILETNTLPGMTETSLIPQQVQYAGQNMRDILSLLLQNS